LQHLWERFPAFQRQQLCQALSLLIARRLVPSSCKEVTHETR
jgi:hypothetical protein